MDYFYYVNMMQRRRTALALLVVKKNREIRSRSCAVRNIFKKRKEQGAYHNLIKEMRLTDVGKYYNYLRMMPEDFDCILSKVEPLLKKNHCSTEPISPSEMLALTLRYLASGDSMVSTSYSFRIGKSTISQIIFDVCNALWEVLKEEYLLKPTEENWKNVEKDFVEKWNMPNCIGALDGKHVVIQAPPNSGSDFYNYKGDFSVVLMALCDANYCFTIVDIGAKGRQSDGGIFRQSTLGQMLFTNSLRLPGPSPIVEGEEPLPHFMVADEAFPLSVNVMRPYPGRFLDQHKRVFNYRLSRARRTIENSFGILSAKWRIFRKPILAKLSTVEAIIKASVCLHNFLIKRDQIKEDSRRYCPTNFVDREDAVGNIIEGDWRTSASDNLTRVGQMGGNTYAQTAGNVRLTLTDYFMYENPIEPQWSK